MESIKEKIKGNKILVFLLMLNLILVVSLIEINRENNRLKRQILTLQGNVNSLESDNMNYQNEKSTLVEEIETLKQENEELEKKNDNTETIYNYFQNQN